MLTASTEEDAVDRGGRGWAPPATLQKHSGPEELAVADSRGGGGETVADTGQRTYRRVFALIRGQRRSHHPGGALDSLTDQGAGGPEAVCWRQVVRPDRRGRGQQDGRPSGTRSTASRTSWDSIRSRSWWSGPCATACWTGRSRPDEDGVEPVVGGAVCPSLSGHCHGGAIIGRRRP